MRINILGHENKSAEGYMASDVQLQILSPEEYKHEKKRLRVVWECNGQTMKQTCSIRQYIEPDANKSLGFHTLFKKRDVQLAKGRIKVTCSILPALLLKDDMEKNGKKWVRQKKRQRQQSMLDFVVTKTKKRKLNKGIVKKRKYKNYFIRDDVQFPALQLTEALKRFSNKLGKITLFDLIPSIDCFSSDDNYQRICKEYITEEQDYFSDKYEDIDFWKNKTAWCFPPYHRKTIVDCINSFKRRKMKGYVCIPYDRNMTFIAQTQRICKEYIGMRGRDKKHSMFIVDKSDIMTRCPFETMIFLFDYQETARNT